MEALKTILRDMISLLVEQKLQPTSSARKLFNFQGYNPRPIFSVEPNWHPHIFNMPMEPHWKYLRVGDGNLNCKGSSYFLIPSPSPNMTCSARLTPTSGYYQAFFGVYILPPVDGERIPLTVLGEVGGRDNWGWLSYVGDPMPLSETLESVIEPIAFDTEGNPVKWAAASTYQMHSDLGDRYPRNELPELICPARSEAWKEFVDSYHPLTLTSAGTVWYHHDYLIMNYANFVEFHDKHGRLVNTYHDSPHFPEEIARMLNGLQIFDDRKGFSCPPLPDRVYARYWP